MNYKYKKWQLFGKRLDVPNDILTKIYNCKLSIAEYIEYQLYDKIPTSCVIESERKILEKFGVEKGKEINNQLDGLKLFMDEFSNIDKKESQHLVLWDDYLIYSVMFNINKKIQNEYSKYFD